MRPEGVATIKFYRQPVKVWRWDLRERIPFDDCLVRPTVSDSGVTIKTPNGVATRVAATVDASSNRTAMTLTPSA
jgi:hypothetical protein